MLIKSATCSAPCALQHSLAPVAALFSSTEPITFDITYFLFMFTISLSIFVYFIHCSLSTKNNVWHIVGTQYTYFLNQGPPTAKCFAFMTASKPTL